MIKLIRLITGEDIISDIDKKDDVLVLKQPHRLILTQEGLGSMPLCPFAKSTNFEISLKNVLFEADPEPQIRDSYASQTGSIVVASGQILKP